MKRDKTGYIPSWPSKGRVKTQQTDGAWSAVLAQLPKQFIIGPSKDVFLYLEHSLRIKHVPSADQDRARNGGLNLLNQRRIERRTLTHGRALQLPSCEIHRTDCQVFTTVWKRSAPTFNFLHKFYTSSFKRKSCVASTTDREVWSWSVKQRAFWHLQDSPLLESSLLSSLGKLGILSFSSLFQTVDPICVSLFLFPPLKRN